MYTADYWKVKLDLLPHPEGGFYKETYKASEVISKDCLPSRFGGDRSFSTAIYFMLEQGDISVFHKIKSDELWHFYAGQTLEVYCIDLKGELTVFRLGSDFEAGDSFQVVVPANCWFASKPASESTFSLMGCTVAPGFDFGDFEMANRKELIAIYPQHSEIITTLTHNTYPAKQ